MLQHTVADRDWSVDLDPSSSVDRRHGNIMTSEMISWNDSTDNLSMPLARICHTWESDLDLKYLSNLAAYCMIGGPRARRRFHIQCFALHTGEIIIGPKKQYEKDIILARQKHLLSSLFCWDYHGPWFSRPVDSKRTSAVCNLIAHKRGSFVSCMQTILQTDHDMRFDNLACCHPCHRAAVQ